MIHSSDFHSNDFHSSDFNFSDLSFLANSNDYSELKP
jgi:hypothetical protein